MPEAPSTPMALLTLLEHCRRMILQRVKVLQQLEVLPSRLGRTFAQDLVEGVVSCGDYEAMYLVDYYRAIKLQLDAPPL